MKIQRMLLVMIAVLGMFGSDAFAIYDTGTGRFMQRDPLGYVDGMNLYAYTRSSPLNFTDPMGLKIVVEGGARNRQAVQDALQQLCPGATVEDDGSVTIDDFDPDSCAGQKDLDGNDCGESPGCDMLRDMNNSPNRYPIKSRRGGGGFNWRWKSPNSPVTYFITFDPNSTEPIYRIDDNGDRVFDRDGEAWEVLWHELTHAHRNSTGEHPFDPNLLPHRNPSDRQLRQEEVDTINIMNKMRKWWQGCGGGRNNEPNNIAPRDPNGH